MTAIHPDTPQHGSAPIKLAPKKRPPLLSFALPATAIASGVMLGLAIPNIINANDWLDYAKAAVLGFSGMAVSFAVNKTAVERGAELGTKGYHGATTVSVLSIIAVGTGLWAATYSGLTLKDTAELQLQEHGQSLGVYVGQRSEAAAEAARVLPAIRAIDADLRQKHACEIQASCISGRGNGGNGPVARAVGELAGRASSIGQQIEAGDAARQDIVGRLNASIAEYQTILGDEAKDVWERRAKLQVVDAGVRQSIGDLNQSMPLTLIAAYAGELQGGTRIADRAEAQARLNGILSRHGQSLASVAGSIEDMEAVPPAFPKRTGVSDTFGYIAHFLPVAAIAFVVELVFPIVLFAYTYWEIAWGVYGQQYRASRPRDADEMVAVAHETEPTNPPTANGADQSEMRRRSRNGHFPRERDRHLDT